MNSLLDQASFKDELIDSLIALRFDENSESAKMFKAIYPAKKIPSIHLISSEGKEIEQVNGLVTKDELVKTINAALATHQSLKLTSAQQDSSSLTSSQQETNSQPTDSQPTSEAGSLKRANDSPVLSQKDKEKHAQDLLKELRVKKAKEEEALALEREKNRIKSGKT